MSAEISHQYSEVRIERKHHKAALAAIKSLVPWAEKVGYGCGEEVPDFYGVDLADLEGARTLKGALRMWNWAPTFAEEDGAIVDLEYVGEPFDRSDTSDIYESICHWAPEEATEEEEMEYDMQFSRDGEYGDDDLLFVALAPFVASGSYIAMSMNAQERIDGVLETFSVAWRWHFVDGRVYEEAAIGPDIKALRNPWKPRLAYELPTDGNRLTLSFIVERRPRYKAPIQPYWRPERVVAVALDVIKESRYEDTGRQA